MQNKTRKNWIIAGVFLLLFLLLTAAVLTVDVQPIGPNQSQVGLATVNGALLFDVNLLWYRVTDWLGIAAVLVALGFAALGCMQLIRRRRVRRVDRSILALGGCYAAVAAAYLLFEVWIVNYRPVLLDGGLEASFPSSHTLLVLCVMSTAILQFRSRIRHPVVRGGAILLSAASIVLTIIGRLLSGVHWFTDIAGGLFLGTSLVFFYAAAIKEPDPTA